MLDAEYIRYNVSKLKITYKNIFIQKLFFSFQFQFEIYFFLIDQVMPSRNKELKITKNKIEKTA